MLYELLQNGYGKDHDWNCAEKILYGANEAYHLGLDRNAFKLAAGFGGVRHGLRRQADMAHGH